MIRTLFMIYLMAVGLVAPAVAASQSPSPWQEVETVGSPTARHEAALVAFRDRLFLIGGRRVNPVDMFDPVTGQWTAKSSPPIEIHHFQAVTLGDAIYIVGAMTGAWPNEKPLEKLLIYHPGEDRFEYGAEIPAHRRRGGAGVVVHDGKIYMVGGIVRGHMDGYVPWLDEFDPTTGQWQVLPDAPQARDHFQAVMIGNKLHAFAGRRTEQALGKGFSQTTEIGDVFDFGTGRWVPMQTSRAIPTGRAGNMAIGWQGQLIIGGGESGVQTAAHDDVEVYDPAAGSWYRWASLARGRHGSGFAIIGDYLYAAAGSGNRGGEPELTSLERLHLPSARRHAEPINKALVDHLTVMQWHKLQLSFTGPDSGEMAATNPFTDYRLMVTFTHEETSRTVRGFYAADGRAGESGADAGNVWQVRFTPDRPGEWQWRARLAKGRDIAIDLDPAAGEEIGLDQSSGRFLVIASDKAAPDFRHAARGFLEKRGGYFHFRASGKPWLKGGANSPENLLGYEDFDGTYRMADNARDGESNAGAALHRFTPHLKDWRSGDPEWRDGKGRGLIGAINYLASVGMNSVYFLTLNIMGDGKDVWPYRDPADVTRFDVSKLEQWETIFDHMQAKGILLHMVIQETENELMLDGGNTGRERQLYLAELIARFGHHNGLVWNLGEENGPVHWRPEGQNDDQRRQMMSFFAKADPYGHPVLLHTHSEPDDKDKIAGPLLGESDLAGLSLQISERQLVNAETRKWRHLAAATGHGWLLTMDEIGKWDTGALPDALDQTDHQSLRQHALWGHLLGGGAGVEWYFGAHYPANDLTSEDWRLRDSLWRQTKIALDFFANHLPYTQMAPCNARIDRKDGYCFGKNGEIFAIYLPGGGRVKLAGGIAINRDYSVMFLDPVTGETRAGRVTKMTAGGTLKIETPTSKASQDWVTLITAK